MSAPAAELPTADGRHSGEVVVLPPGTSVTAAGSHELAVLAETRNAYRKRQKAPATVRAYRSDWRDFTAWCRRHDVCPLPVVPERLADYVADMAAVRGLAFSTITRRLASIAMAHRKAGLPSPRDAEVVLETIEGVARTHGTAPKPKEPARWPVIKAMAASIEGDRLADVRDRALLLVGFGGAFRRSELVALDVADVRFVLEGVRLTLRRSKTDQAGAGRLVVIPHGPSGEPCAVDALRTWLRVADITEGAVFRPIDRWERIRPTRLGAGHVAVLVKRAADACGLDPRQFAGHSLRSGHATSAAATGAPQHKLMEQTGHRSADTLGRYVRDGRRFTDASAAYAMTDRG